MCDREYINYFVVWNGIVQDVFEDKDLALEFADKLSKRRMGTLVQVMCVVAELVSQVNTTYSYPKDKED